VAGVDLDDLGDRAEHTGQAVASRDDGPRPILAVEAEAQRVVAGGDGAALPLDLAFLGLQRGDLLLGGGQGGRAGLVGAVEVDLT
jgi:hypothetical protein